MKQVRRYCALVPKSVSSPYFVKVGANDGTTGDPVSEVLLADRRWKGLLVEPVPYCFERLSRNFCDASRFSLDQVAIGGTSGTTTFYYVDPKAAEQIPDLPRWYDQLGSFDKNHILNHLDGILEPFIVESRMEVIVLEELLVRRHVQKIDLLHIDVEGYDYEVLKTIDLKTRKPAAILLEHKHIAAGDKVEMLELLRDTGYGVDDCGGDYFAVQGKSRLRYLVADHAVAS